MIPYFFLFFTVHHRWRDEQRGKNVKRYEVYSFISKREEVLYNKVKKNSTCIHYEAALNRLCYLQEEDARLEAKEARDTDKSAAFLQ